MTNLKITLTKILNSIPNHQQLSARLRSKSNRHTREKIVQQTSFLDQFKNVTINERVFCILNNLSGRPRCKQCNKEYVRFGSIKVGYILFCSPSCASNNLEVKQKTKSTHLQKYGKWFLQTEKCRKLTRQICLERYCTDNFSKSTKFKTRIRKINKSKTNKEKTISVEKNKRTKKMRYGNENYNNRDKFRRTMMERYGVLSPFLLSNKYYSKISQELFWSVYKKLPVHLRRKTYFAELNKKYGEFGITSKSGRRYYLDFVISSIKFCIEFNGDIFHANPKVFSENDRPSFCNPDLTSKEIWLKDQEKIEAIQEVGLNLMIVWESDYLHSKEEVINQCICNVKQLTIPLGFKNLR